MLSDILMFAAGLVIASILYGIFGSKRGNQEIDQKRLRKRK